MMGALEADRAGQIVRALELYEEAAEAEPSLDMLVNMAVLYWQVTDYGFWTGHHLPSELVGVAGARIFQILDLAQSRFPGSPQVEFWRKYIAWADLGEPFELDDCRRILKQHPGYLEPLAYLFSVTEGQEGRDLVPALLEQAQRQGTQRSRYVTSVVESVVRQAAWRVEH